MSYSPDLAAALSGASMRQLQYWRSGRTAEPLLAPEHYQPRTRVMYSFQDVIALRTFVYLRSREIPLQKVRKAVEGLRKLGETDHLSSYRLVPIGKNVAWKVSPGEAHDLTSLQQPHPVLADMVDVLAEFVGQNDRSVVDLHRPKHGVEVDPQVRGGYPVIEGTRVPYDAVSALLRDGVTVDGIAEFYPSVDPRSAQGAFEFAQYVDQYRNVSALAS